jgi:hypothetical protein
MNTPKYEIGTRVPLGMGRDYSTAIVSWYWDAGWGEWRYCVWCIYLPDAESYRTQVRECRESQIDAMFLSGERIGQVGTEKLKDITEVSE